MGLHCKTPAYGRDRTEIFMSMDGAARKRSFLWAARRANAHCYNRYYTQHSLLRPVARANAYYYGRCRAPTRITMVGAALQRILLWSVPRTNAHYYGQHRAQTFIFMDGTDAPFGPYKVIQRGGKTVFSRFASFCLAILSQSHNVVS